MIERDLNQIMQVDPSNSPRDGDLWITGTTGGREWYYAVPHGGDCFTLFDRGREVGPDVWFSVGLRLPKAPEFEAPGLPSLNMDRGVHFCLDENGQVVHASL